MKLNIYAFIQRCMKIAPRETAYAVFCYGVTKELAYALGDIVREVSE